MNIEPRFRYIVETAISQRTANSDGLLRLRLVPRAVFAKPPKFTIGVLTGASEACLFQAGKPITLALTAPHWSAMAMHTQTQDPQGRAAAHTAAGAPGTPSQPLGAEAPMSWSLAAIDPVAETAALNAGRGLVVELSGLFARAGGSYNLYVEEHYEPEPSALDGTPGKMGPPLTARTAVAIEIGHYALELRSFIARSGATPCLEFKSSDEIRLSWEGNAETYRIYGLPAGPTEVKGAGLNLPPNTLKRDATLILEASSKSGGGREQTLYQTLALRISDPQIRAASVVSDVVVADAIRRADGQDKVVDVIGKHGEGSQARTVMTTGELTATGLADLNTVKSKEVAVKEGGAITFERSALRLDGGSLKGLDQLAAASATLTSATAESLKVSKEVTLDGAIRSADVLKIETRLFGPPRNVPLPSAGDGWYKIKAKSDGFFVFWVEPYSDVDVMWASAARFEVKTSPDGGNWWLWGPSATGGNASSFSPGAQHWVVGSRHNMPNGQSGMTPVRRDDMLGIKMKHWVAERHTQSGVAVEARFRAVWCPVGSDQNLADRWEDWIRA